MGLFSFIPLYAISVHKFSTLMSGMILTPRSLAMTVTSAATSFLLRRLGYRWPMVIGFITMGLGIILLHSLLLTSAGGAGGVIGTFSIIMFLNGISAGMVFPSANNACIELMPEKVGTIVGLRNMFKNRRCTAISLITFVLHLSLMLLPIYDCVYFLWNHASCCCSSSSHAGRCKKPTFTHTPPTVNNIHGR